jgi:hypothetical protein
VPVFDYYDFRVLSFFFKLILTQRPGYLFADLIGARSARISNFIFPSVSPRASVLVRGIRLWNQLPLAIKNVRSVAAFLVLRRRFKEDVLHTFVANSLIFELNKFDFLLIQYIIGLSFLECWCEKIYYFQISRSRGRYYWLCALGVAKLSW